MPALPGVIINLESSSVQPYKVGAKAMARSCMITGNCSRASRTLWRTSLWSLPSSDEFYWRLTCSGCPRSDFPAPIRGVGGKQSKPRLSTALPISSRNPPGLRPCEGMENISRSTAVMGAAKASIFSTQKSNDGPSLKSRLVAGEKLYGAFSVSFSSVAAEILGWAGYDFVVVDTEHGPGDTFAALPVLQALAATNTPAVIRLPINDPVMVKKALDLGPAGLMFPMIESAEDARRAVAACRYPPLGIRGAAHPVVRASRYGLDPSYLDTCEQNLLIMCQVETEAAVDRVPEIVGVEGVDCIQMGPLDLRASIGLLRRPGDPGGLALLKRAETAILSCERKVLLAGFSTPESPPEALFERGYNLVSGTVDVALLRDAAVADIEKNKPGNRR